MTARTALHGPRPMPRPQPRSQLPWQVRMLMLAAMWGLSFVFIKISDEALAPLQVALGRVILGTVTLMIVLRVRRERLPRDPRLWAQLAVAALLFNSAPFTLFAYGETHITSVLAGILNATTPLLTLLVSMMTLPEEKPTRARAVGLVLGFAGVLVVLGIWTGLGAHALAGSLACLGASACYALGFPFTRRYLSGRPESTVTLATGQLLTATIELAVVTPLFTALPHSLPAKVVVSMVCLGALGTGIAYILNYGLIRDAGATNASIVTYIVPLFSTVAGLVFLGERLRWNQPVGAVIVIVGIMVSQGRLSWRGRARR